MAKKATKTGARKATTARTAKSARTSKAPAAGASKAAGKTASKPVKITAAKNKPRTKSEIYAILAESAGVSKREVATVFDTMQQMIAADLKKGSVGVFNVPGLMKVMVQRKPATKARKGINPFTKEETVFKAKPARNVVKVRPLKGLKDAV